MVANTAAGFHFVDVSVGRPGGMDNGLETMLLLKVTPRRIYEVKLKMMKVLLLLLPLMRLLPDYMPKCQVARRTDRHTRQDRSNSSSKTISRPF